MSAFKSYVCLPPQLFAVDRHGGEVIAVDTSEGYAVLYDFTGDQQLAQLQHEHFKQAMGLSLTWRWELKGYEIINWLELGIIPKRFLRL